MNLVELPLPKVGDINKKADDLDKAKTYMYKEDDIEAVSNFTCFSLQLV